MVEKKETKEVIEDTIKSLQRKQMQLVVDADKLAKELQETMEKYYELSDDYVKIQCLFCNGNGFIKNDEGDGKVKCPYCNLKMYIWAKKYV